jgi:regulator of RNase E activity RraB
MKSILAAVALMLLMSFSDLFGLAKKPDLDQAVLQQLKKAGSDLSKPHEIEFFLYFPSQSIADSAAVQIKAAGFEVEVRPAGRGADWLCYAKKTMVPELTALQKIRRDFNAIASSKGGQYDGWGTGVVK